ncbi:MAG: ParB/RepB/Spo0J family partition protein [Acidobacteriota bacterium]
MQAGTEFVKVSQVRIAGKNVRSRFNKEDLEELAASIKENGILQPLVCRRTKNGLEVVAGERRLRAAKMVGLTEVPVVVREIRDDDLIHIRLIENLQRTDLPIEDQFQALSSLRQRGLGVQKISKITGLSTTKINRILGLEDLEPSIRKRNDLAEHAKEFLAKAPPQVQKTLAERIAREKIGTRVLSADIMPAINKAMQEKVFTKETREQVIKKIAEQATDERPAKSIFRQERGKLALKSTGADAQLVATEILSELVRESEAYYESLAGLRRTRFEHLDPGLVMRLVKAFRDVHSMLTAILESLEQARQRKRNG